MQEMSFAEAYVSPRYKRISQKEIDYNKGGQLFRGKL